MKRYSYTVVYPGDKNLSKEEQSKLDLEKVGKLVDCSNILDIYYDGIFDNLMDKMEKSPDLFHYIYDVIYSMVMRDNDPSLIRMKFLELLKMSHANQIAKFSIF